MIPTLHPYQQTAVQNIRSAMGKERRVLFVLATGGGKTIIFSYITASAIAKGRRVYIVVHRNEIIDQICAALTQFNVPHGRIQPGRTPTNDMVQVAMVQTISRRLDVLPAPDLIVIDEAHHSITGSYQLLTEVYSAARVLGVTATPERLDGRGLREAFDVMVQGPSTRWLIENGFLANFDYYAPPSNVDLSGIKTSMGDYKIDELAVAIDKPTITGDAVAHYKKYLYNKPAVAFCVTIAHARHVAETFTAAGIAATFIDGKMSLGERTARLNGLRDGSIKVITSCDLISEGFDLPAVAGAILLRPTKSLGLDLQQCGRVLRLKPDGSRAVILDHVGNVTKHGTPKTERAWSLDSKKRKADVGDIKQCKACFMAFDKAEMATYNCDNSEHEKCLFNKKIAEEMAFAERQIEHVAGELTEISESPAWAGGINIARASGLEFKAMMAKAESIAELREIARIRGYSAKWPFFILKSRRERKSAHG